MNQPRNALVVGLAVALVIGTGCSGLGQVTLKIEHGELQGRLDKKFPISKSKSVFKVVFTEPRLELIAESDKLQLTVAMQGSALGSDIGQGDVTIRGGIRYDKPTKSFYMTDPEITRIDLERIPSRYQDKLRRAVDVAVQELLPTMPIYKLDKDTFKHSLNRAFLKRAWVDDHILHLEMGL